MKFLFPRLSAKAWLRILQGGVFGALIAGAYGIVHDQVTYTLGPEYFTRFKFLQFAANDPGMGERAFVAVIGFLATWWVGLISGWVVARLSIGRDGAVPCLGRVMKPFLLIVGATALSGWIGWVVGGRAVEAGVLEDWRRWQEELGIEDLAAFVRVGYVHNFGYLGALVGLVAAGVWARIQAVRGNGAGPATEGE